MDLDFWDCFGRKTTVLQLKKYGNYFYIIINSSVGTNSQKRSPLKIVIIVVVVYFLIGLMEKH